MRYLEKSFTIAVSDRHAVKKSEDSGIVEEFTPKPEPRIGHEYLPYGAACFECGLDRIGCTARFGGLGNK